MTIRSELTAATACTVLAIIALSPLGAAAKEQATKADDLDRGLSEINGVGARSAAAARETVDVLKP